MKRFHVHLHVDDLARNIGFYSRLFALEPARVESDYAKWMLDDPPVNFAISTRGAGLGVDHFGIQADSAEELDALKSRARLRAWFWMIREKRPAATPAARNTGSPIHKDWLGSTSTRWAPSPSMARRTALMSIRWRRPTAVRRRSKLRRPPVAAPQKQTPLPVAARKSHVALPFQCALSMHRQFRAFNPGRRAA